MATHAAIAATSNALLGLLESAAAGEAEVATASFSLYNSEDLRRSIGERLVLSLHLYHVAVNTSRRNVGPQVDALGVRRKPPIPLDLHYLLTAWSKDPTTQQRALGWAVRVIHDTATLPAAILNRHAPEDVFRAAETVEVVWQNLTRQEVADIWEVARTNQQPSASYVARIVEIESTVSLEEYPLVQTRDFAYGAVARP